MTAAAAAAAATTTTTLLVPGAHQDGADLYGIVVAFVVIAVCVAAVRVLFRSR